MYILMSVLISNPLCWSITQFCCMSSLYCWKNPAGKRLFFPLFPALSFISSVPFRQNMRFHASSFFPFILVSLCLCLSSFLLARPHGEQRAPFIDQHKVPNKWAENESYARGSQAQPRLLRTPSILISILMKRLLLAGCP